MEELKYVMIVIGGVLWTSAVCWVVWYLSTFDSLKDDEK